MKHLLAITPKSVQWIPIPALTAIGGADSTGYALNHLKNRGDYVVVTTQDNRFHIHPVIGNARGAVILQPMESLSIDDLKLISIDTDRFRSASPNKKADWLTAISEFAKVFAQIDDWQESLKSLLQTILEITEMSKGLIITRVLKGYQISASEGLTSEDSWLSESLIKETIDKQSPITIQNIFGSGFETNKSLMATGFLSVFTWPLVFREEVIGVLVVGSERPHSGLTKETKEIVGTFIQLAALALWFHERDLKLKEEIKILKSRLDSNDSALLTQNSELLNTCKMATQVAPSLLSVFIHGETGVGKELLATWMHKKSERSQKPFVVINCGAIPGELIESLLFGHKKGAFTSAHQDQVGKFQQAHGGTLFLDEIGDLPAALQVKLLRVLQEKVIEPVGSQKTVNIDVRIVSASHKNLIQLVQKGLFREDLYYRLAEVTLEILPLRERPEDILLLASSFLKTLAPEKTFSRGAWKWLENQRWHGNTRELLAAVKRATIFSTSKEIQTQDFLKGQPSKGSESKLSTWLDGKDLEEAKLNFTLLKIKEALEMSAGNRTKAAELLGITPRTLFRYLEEARGSSKEKELGL